MPPTFPHGRKEGRGPIAVLCRVRDVFPAGFYVSAGLKWPRRDSLRVAAHRDEPDAKFENATCARRASAERSSPAHREEHDGDSLRPRAAHGRVGSVPRTGAAGPAPRRSHARARAPRESLARPGQRECGEQPAPRRRLEGGFDCRGRSAARGRSDDVGGDDSAASYSRSIPGTRHLGGRRRAWGRPGAHFALIAINRGAGSPPSASRAERFAPACPAPDGRW